MTIVTIAVILMAVLFFGLLLLGLCASAPQETPDEQAECIRKDAEERARKRKAREERRKRK